jgi:hypothetical protein
MHPLVRLAAAAGQSGCVCDGQPRCLLDPAHCCGLPEGVRWGTGKMQLRVSRDEFSTAWHEPAVEDLQKRHMTADQAAYGPRQILLTVTERLGRRRRSAATNRGAGMIR